MEVLHLLCCRPSLSKDDVEVVSRMKETPNCGDKLGQSAIPNHGQTTERSRDPAMDGSKSPANRQGRQAIFHSGISCFPSQIL